MTAGPIRARLSLGAALTLVALLTPNAARADDPEVQLHGDIGVAHAIENPQQSEYGFGARAGVAGELTFRKVFGLQAEVAFLGLADGSPPSNPAIANHGAGFDFTAMGGFRLHPFGRFDVAGLWLDGNFGLASTGNAARPSVDTHLGYDFRVGTGRFDLGPFVGYSQIFQPTDTLRPADAHILFGGLHIALGARRRPLPSPLAQTATATTSSTTSTRAPT